MSFFSTLKAGLFRNINITYSKVGLFFKKNIEKKFFKKKFRKKFQKKNFLKKNFENFSQPSQVPSSLFQQFLCLFYYDVIYGSYTTYVAVYTLCTYVICLHTTMHYIPKVMTLLCWALHCSHLQRFSLLILKNNFLCYVYEH